ncbi:MAG: hypothetical protein JWO59_711 [Chloroflexi bacterium]|nr:hypothetical protein [Chloroflexota bacterium]
MSRRHQFSNASLNDACFRIENVGGDGEECNGFFRAKRTLKGRYGIENSLFNSRQWPTRTAHNGQIINC